MTPDEREELRRLRAMRDRMRAYVAETDEMLLRSSTFKMGDVLAQNKVVESFLRDLDAERDA